MKKLPKRILVVDDDPGTIHLLKKWLSVGGYEVMTASNGKEGLEKVRKELPDLVLLDVLMPDVLGVEMALRMQDEEDTQDIPVVFMTVTIDIEKDKGNETINVFGRSYRAFAKPLHNRKLQSVIRKEINKRIHGNR